MNLTGDFFTLFQLAPGFDIDLAKLEARYLEIQNEVHPDRFAQAAPQERRLSMQLAARVNEAYQTLKKPLERARYLLSLMGHDLEAESHVRVEPEFLMAQMAWREAVQEARSGGDRHELERLRQRLALELDERYRTLAALLDAQRDFSTAAGHVRQLMFLERLRGDLDEALDFLDDTLA